MTLIIGGIVFILCFSILKDWWICSFHIVGVLSFTPPKFNKKKVRKMFLSFSNGWCLRLHVTFPRYISLGIFLTLANYPHLVGRTAVLPRPPRVAFLAQSPVMRQHSNCLCRCRRWCGTRWCWPKGGRVLVGGEVWEWGVLVELDVWLWGWLFCNW